MFTQPVRVEPLDRGHDLGVELAAPVLQQAPVGHLVRERVLEGVLQVREELRLVEELRFLQMGEPAPQGLLRLLRDRRQQRVGHVLADHRGRLQQLLLLWRQPVDARRQDRLHRRRDLQRLHRPRQPVRSALPASAPVSTSVRTVSSRKNGLPRFTSICVSGASPGSGPSSAASNSAALSAGRLSSRSWE